MDAWARRIHAMERDIQFLYFLFSAPIYKGQSPNLFERLQELGRQAADLGTTLRKIDPERPEALQAAEQRMHRWKAEVYGFLENAILSEDFE